MPLKNFTIWRRERDLTVSDIYEIARSFDQLTLSEQETAMEKLYNHVLDELILGNKVPLDDKVASAAALANSTFITMEHKRIAMLRDPIVDEWVAEIAGMIAAEAFYVPDDGAMVVRL